MRNIELRTTNNFGVTNTEKFNGRKLTRYVKKEAAERNVSESQVIRDFVENHFFEYYSDKEITSFEFSWRDEFNHKCKIIQYDIVVANKEIFTKVQREIDSNINKYQYNYYSYKCGKELFNEWYDWISDFYEGFAIVQREDDNGDYLCNFIDKEGKILSEEWFKWVDYFNKDGFADVERTNGEQCKIDKNGKIVSKTTINSNNIKTKEKMTTRIKTIAKIKDVTFRNKSVYGNPSYFITFEDEKGNILIGYTKPNADCAYGCKNPDLKEFAYIEYHSTKSGKIIIDMIFNKSTYERLFSNQNNK